MPFLTGTPSPGGLHYFFQRRLHVRIHVIDQLLIDPAIYEIPQHITEIFPEYRQIRQIILFLKSYVFREFMRRGR
jgi:hypothetical protein